MNFIFPDVIIAGNLYGYNCFGTKCPVVFTMDKDAEIERKKMSKTKAIIVGVSNYTLSGANNLTLCQNDIMAIKDAFV